MAVVAHALTTLARVKTFLEITNTSKDGLIELLIDACTDWIESECGNRRFKNSGSDITEYHDGDYDLTGRDKIFPRQFPIATLTSIAYKTGDNASPTWTVINANGYERNDQDGIIYFANESRSFLQTLPRGRQNIRLIYQGGYTTIPTDLELCCIKLVAKELNKSKSQGLTSESVGGANFAWNEDIAPDVKKIIANYKRWLR